MIDWLILGAIGYFLGTRINSTRKSASKQISAVVKQIPVTSTITVTTQSHHDQEEDDSESLSEYIGDCADDWGMTEEQVENNLGFDKD